MVYEPRGAAQQLWRNKSPEVLIEGPAGTGKTRAILEKLVGLCVQYPKSRHLITRKTRASMTESVLVTLEEKVLPPGSPIASGPQRAFRHNYTFANGSSIVVSGLDHPERTFSTEYDTLTVFEAIEATENDWESLQRALRNGKMNWHQAIADTNPGAPTHWLNQRANANRIERLLSRHEDNPAFYDADKGDWTEAGAKYIAILDNLSGHRKARLRFGKWAAAEGIVYEDYDAAIHLIDRFDVSPSWRRIRSIDFGYTNPFVCQWWAIDPDGRMFLYREIYTTKKLVQEHAEKIKKLSEGEKIEATVSDHDAEDRATLHKYGIPTQPAIKPIGAGIEAVSLRLRKAGDGRPRIFVMRDSLVERDQSLVDSKLPCCTAEEFDGYIWPKSAEGKAIKEEPVDLNNHGMDAMRYAVMHRPLARLPGRVHMMS